MKDMALKLDEVLENSSLKMYSSELASQGMYLLMFTPCKIIY